MMLRDEFPVHKNRTWRWVMMDSPEVEKVWGRGLAWRVMGMPSQG
jgi:rhamnogalacturonyl hydrolase YesR